MKFSHVYLNFMTFTLWLLLEVIVLYVISDILRPKLSKIMVNLCNYEWLSFCLNNIFGPNLMGIFSIYD